MGQVNAEKEIAAGLSLRCYLFPVVLLQGLPYSYFLLSTMYRTTPSIIAPNAPN